MSTTCLSVYDLLRITYTYEAQAMQSQTRKRADSACSVCHVHVLLGESLSNIAYRHQKYVHISLHRRHRTSPLSRRTLHSGIHRLGLGNDAPKTSLNDVQHVATGIREFSTLVMGVSLSCAPHGYFSG
jgi:hypothetical protein